MLSKIFTWWNGATIGTLFNVGRSGVQVGTDEFGNRYYEAKTNRNSYDGRKRRWVIFNGYAEGSKVPPGWFGWLHHTTDERGDVPVPRREWEKDYLPNLSGTPFAWRPKGSLARGGERAPATGDYEAWKPE
ncbi:MAG TPA: NADH:ubiquinone oxidoreductase subunit NDUFA12 [Caulobacteraceae bacterium]|nr:NADH:ubiquinone oxidoreductase subunit NDUFA12 [Caulobacteraceae bacterium]